MGSLHYLLFELVPMRFSHYPILWKGLGGQSHSGSTRWTLPSTGIGYTVQKAVWSPPNQHYITRSSDKDSNKTKDRRRARQFAPRLVMQPCPLSCHLTSVDREPRQWKCTFSWATTSHRTGVRGTRPSHTVKPPHPCERKILAPPQNISWR